jgi:putative chitinase
MRGPFSTPITPLPGSLFHADPHSEDGYIYRGRGYIQLTGRANYVVIGLAAGIPDLAIDPDRAASPGLALALAAAF